MLQVPREDWLGDVQRIPLHSALLLIRLGLSSYGSDLSPAAEGYARGSAQHLVQRCMACLFYGEERVKQAVLKGVLPAVADCAALIGSQTYGSFLATIWDCARYFAAVHEGLPSLLNKPKCSLSQRF
jgi:hypothetical protein